jgi:molybdopterin-dependent oxidoreductase-like protein protein
MIESRTRPDVRNETHEGTEQHTYRGVWLYTVIDPAGLQLDSDRKNDQRRKYVLVTAKDGYGAVVSWGEIDPEYADAPILLAWEEDGQILTGKDGPVRLVVLTD